MILLVLYIVLDIWIQALGVFLVVIWHELWHCIVAYLNGIKVREVELLPFGGVAKLDGLLEESGSKEIKVALAGPLSNFFLATVIATGLTLHLFYHPMAYFLFLYNIVIGVFNLLPTLPLDGGRIVRGWLSGRIGLLRATRITARMGQAIAIILLLCGTVATYYQWVDFHLVIIALFIWIGATREREEAFYIHWRSLLNKKKRNIKEKVHQAEYLVSKADVELKQILPRLVTNKYNLITVIDKNGTAIGTVSEDELLDSIGKLRHDAEIKTLLKKS